MVILRLLSISSTASGPKTAGRQLVLASRMIGMTWFRLKRDLPHDQRRPGLQKIEKPSNW